MTPGAPRFALVPLRGLRPHEETDPKTVAELADRIETDGCLQTPVVVDQGSRVILDGHHRYRALERLGCRLAACHLVDYMDPSIQVDRWDDGRPMDKQALIGHALSGELYPIKTSRHRRLARLPNDPTPLAWLHPEEDAA